MSLTDLICRTVKCKERAFKLADSNGLYLEIMPNGSKYWRYKYRFNKKEKRLAIGVYPLVTLAEARVIRDEAKKALSNNIDPSDAKRDKRRAAYRNAEVTFKAIAIEWHNNQKERLSSKYFKNVLCRLEADIFPEIGPIQIAKVDAPMILEALRKVENRGALDLTRRLRQVCSQIFRYAIQSGKCKMNPVVDIQGALKTRPKVHFASIEPKEIPALLTALENNDARLFARTRRAIRLLMLTFVRPGELLKMRWADIQFKKCEWHIPAEYTKARRSHIVPLSKQSIEILNEQKRETGHLKTEWIFPSQIRPKDCMSSNTIRLGVHRLGFKDQMTAHGFRALARTTIREELEYAPDIIEFQLAHKATGPLGAAYDRAQFLKQRTKMMQDWADYLDKVL